MLFLPISASTACRRFTFCVLVFACRSFMFLVELAVYVCLVIFFILSGFCVVGLIFLWGHATFSFFILPICSQTIFYGKPVFVSCKSRFLHPRRRVWASIQANRARGSWGPTSHFGRGMQRPSPFVQERSLKKCRYTPVSSVQFRTWYIYLKNTRFFPAETRIKRHP